MKTTIISVLLCLSVCKVIGQADEGFTYDPYKLLSGMTDTLYKSYNNNTDSFLIQYVHSGSYMSTMVLRMICDIDSSRKDTMNYIDGSTGEEGQQITFARKNCREDTAAYRRERHFFSHIQVFKISCGNKTPIGKEQFGYYVEAGCYEDLPEQWVLNAKSNPIKRKETIEQKIL